MPRLPVNSNSFVDVALKYKQLLMVERIFRDMKSVLQTRPIFHKCDETIRGHVFCSFLALVLRKELEQALDRAGERFEWEDIKGDLKALQEMTITDRGRVITVRSRAEGCYGKVFQAVGVAAASGHQDALNAPPKAGLSEM